MSVLALSRARQVYKSNVTRTLLDYAGVTPSFNLFLGTSFPDKWEKYLKERYPNCKYRIEQGGININPKK